MDKMTFAKPFGDMLKEKRKLRGLSQMGLAMKSGRSLRCIQYLEAGTTRADFVHVVHTRPYAGSPGYGFD